MKREDFIDELFTIQSLLSATFVQDKAERDETLLSALQKVNNIIHECCLGDQYAVMTGESEKTKMLNERIEHLQKQVDRITLSVPSQRYEAPVVKPINSPKNDPEKWNKPWEYPWNSPNDFPKGPEITCGR